MNRVRFFCLVWIAVGLGFPGWATDRYVVKTGGGDSYSNYLSWATAATNIQMAVDVAASGDIVYVTNSSTYFLTSPIVVTQGITIRSWGGSASLLGLTNTVVDAQSQTRAFLLSHPAAVVAGFQVTNGLATNIDNSGYGGGALIMNGAMMSNCLFRDNVATNGGGACLMSGGSLWNCTVSLNTATNGGGVYVASTGTVSSCVIQSNRLGGGVMAPGVGALIAHSIISHNVAVTNGGGVCGNAPIVRNSLIYTNTASQGGGLCLTGSASVVSCTIVDNGATNGGGIYVTNNPVFENTIIGFNVASNNSDRAEPAGQTNNYNNCCSPNLPTNGPKTNFVTDPTFVNRPANYQLAVNSPCRDTGVIRPWMYGSRDVSGSNSRIINALADIGAYESTNVALSCAFSADRTWGLAPASFIFTATVDGSNRVGLVYRWDFNGDGEYEFSGTNSSVVTNIYTEASYYSVGLLVSNSSGTVSLRRSFGVTNASYIKAGPISYFVSTNGASTWPFTNWAQASTNVMEVVPQSSDADTVLVSNGVYRLTNTLSVTSAATLFGVSGAAATTLDGSNAVRCVDVANTGAFVSGFTIANGNGNTGPGGGVIISNGVVSNCWIVNNKATASLGGGVYMASPQYGVLASCLLTSNSAAQGGGVFLTNGGVVSDSSILSNTVTASGGGVAMLGTGLLYNCGIASNDAATQGGGVWADAQASTSSIIRNCLVTYNRAGNHSAGVYLYNGALLQSCTVVTNSGVSIAPQGVNLAGGGAVSRMENSIAWFNWGAGMESNLSLIGGTCVTSCAPSLAHGSDGNLTNNPLLVNVASNNFRLQVASPCVNAGGWQLWMDSAFDRDGIQRIVSNAVDIGAFEYPFFGIAVAPSSWEAFVMRGALGSTNVQAQNTSLTSNDLYYSLAVNQSWLTTGTGVVPVGVAASIPLGINSIGLALGSYTGQVTVVCSNAMLQSYGATVSQAVTVVMRLMDLGLSPSVLTGSVMQGHSITSAFETWNMGPGSLSFRVDTNAAWLKVAPPTGVSDEQSATPTNTVSVISDATALQVGSYQGLISVVADQGGTPKHVDVGLTVKPSPELVTSVGYLPVYAMQGANATSQVLQILNSSDAFGLNYTVSESVAWLNVSSNSGTLAALATNQLALTFNTALLAPGTYSGVITFTSVDALYGSATVGSPQTVTVFLTVTAKPVLHVNIMAFSNSVAFGHDAASQSFYLWNETVSYALRYEVLDDVSWLKVTPASGLNQGEHQLMTVEYSTAGLQPGTYAGTITVKAYDTLAGAPANASPQRIEVVLQVKSLASLSCDPLSVSNTVARNQSQSHNFTLWNSASDPKGVLAYSVVPDVSWISVSPASGTVTGGVVGVTLTAQGAGLAPGSYVGRVKVQGTDVLSGLESGGSPAYVNVFLTVHSTQSGDFLGDGASSITIYQPQTGTWKFLSLTDGGSYSEVFGGVDYTPAPGDYDGDGVVEIGLFRAAAGLWLMKELGSDWISSYAPWVGTGFVPLAGDYDGDGKTDVAVYKESSGFWGALLSSQGYASASLVFGGSGYSAVPSDYDGDGKVDPAVYQESSGIWFVMLSSGGYLPVSGLFGGPGFKPIPADYNGDTRAELGLYYESLGTWYIITINAVQVAWGLQLGGVGYVPVAGDFNGDGKMDLAVYQRDTGAWYIKSATGGVLHWGLLWGGPGYDPVGATR